MTEWADPMKEDGSEVEGSAPNGSEPGGAAGAENIERSAGMAAGRTTSTEEAVQDMTEDNADEKA